MTPSSDELESFLERLKILTQDLADLGDTQALKPTVITEIKSISKLWLRHSEGLRSTQTVAEESLKLFDHPLNEMMVMTDVRTRATTYRKKLAFVTEHFTNTILIPVIRFEGSPSQVAVRQVTDLFVGLLSADEQNYVDEASRCLASQCNRAAIILFWAAGIARFHGAIVKKGFDKFNAAVDKVALKKAVPFKYASKAHVDSYPELQRCRDFDLIVVGMELWTYDLQVYEELERLLGIRNSAAHPGMLKPSALDVQQFAAKVKDCIFSRIPA